MNFKDIPKKFAALPTAGKIGIASGAGLILYAILNRGSSAQKNVVKDAVIYYPDAAQATVAYDTSNAGLASYLSSGSSGGAGGSTGSGSPFGTGDNLFAVSVGDDPQLNYSAGVRGEAVDFQRGMSSRTVTEGGINYVTNYYADGSKEIYKDGRLVDTANYKYIPVAAGGSRVDTTGTAAAPAAAKSGTVKGWTDLDYQLQQAQLRYGVASAAGDRAGMDAAAAEGQTLRAQGATDIGAAAVWEALNNG